MKKIDTILVPYHLNTRNTGMGLGPKRILDRALGRQEVRKYDFKVEYVKDLSSHIEDKLAAITKINIHLAQSVRKSLNEERFPLVLAGNCITSVGTLAGIMKRPIGIVWFDAHGDFNTPETSQSGFLDGMALSTAVGLCHETIWESLQNKPVSELHVVHVGGRDFDKEEYVNELMGEAICRLN
ncbi:MAG: arginase family protein [Bacillota bacterium]